MASEYTPNYNLDKYVGTDKPNLRDQYNSAMDKIDAQFVVIKNDHTETGNQISAINTNMSQLGERVTAAENKVTAVEGQIATTNATVAGVKATADNAMSLASTNEDNIATIKSEMTQVQQGVTNLQAGKAPTNHASAANTYGVGSPVNFGHLKVVDSGTAAASTGTAASPKMVNDVVNIAPTVLNTENVSFANMTETLSVSVILNAKANMICLSLGELIVHTSAAIDTTVYLTYKLPEQYRPTRKLRTALCTSAAAITVGMNATLDTDGTIGISFGASEPITSGYTIGGNAMFIYGLSR